MSAMDLDEGAALSLSSASHMWLMDMHRLGDDRAQKSILLMHIDVIELLQGHEQCDSAWCYWQGAHRGGHTA